MMTEDRPRLGRTHIVVVTVRIRHALDQHDALAAALAGGGEIVGAVVAEGTGEAEPAHISTMRSGPPH
jgi:hypothetical protein